jgi:lipoprotein-anchoring transpeptidase ErfK/SrfK
MSSSIHNKTVRPGSLKGYSYYYSNRLPVSNSRAKALPAKPASHRGLIILAVLIILGGFYAGFKGGDADKANSSLPAVVTNSTPSTADHCAGNSLEKLIKVSIESRRLWACEGSKLAHTNPVITGLRHHAETETPLGTYKIYGKLTDTTLTGSDSRGSWKDPVSYWQPFLDNQYGTYGFHDATWRKDSAFGQVSPDSQDASHGCIELPLSDSRWLYEWAPVGTTVSVEA